MINKNNIRITKKQKNLIIGTLLGDANLRTETQGRTWNYWALHSINHKDYLMYKYQILKNLCITEPKSSKLYDHRTLKFYESYYLNTKILLGLRFYGNLFYKYENNKWVKQVPKNIIKFLTPEAIAYWYMDNGSIKWLGKSNAMQICTENYNLISLNRIKKAFLTKYKIKLNINKHKKGYRLLINENNSKAFREVIQPFIIPNMINKVSDGNKQNL